MFLLHHHLDTSDRYQIDNEAHIQKKRYFGSLEQVLHDNALHADEGTIMLPETDFMLRKFSIEITTSKPFSISQYKELLHEKKQVMLRETGSEEGLRSYRLCGASGAQDNTALQELLGTTWLLQRNRCCRIPKPHITLALTESFGYVGKRNDRIRLVPRNDALIQLLIQQTWRDSLLLLQLGEQQAELCRIEQGWYHCVTHAPLGTTILTTTAQEQQVEKYLFGDYDQVARNPITKKLLTETIRFYINQLIKRIQPSVYGQLIVLCTPFVQHPLFLESFQESLRPLSNSFLLPLSPRPLPGLPYVRQHKELPVRARRQTHG